MMEINLELTQERYELAAGRIREIAEADITEVAAPFADYFKESAAFLVQMDKVLGAAKSGILFAAPIAWKSPVK